MFDLSTSTQSIRQFAKDTIDSQQNIKIDWDQIDFLVSEIANKKNVINTQTNKSKISFEKQIGLLLLYGSVHYCFTNPKSKKEYQYLSGEKHLSRSLAFITALTEAPVNWDIFSEVRDLKISDWYSILQTSDENMLYDLTKRHDKLTKFASFLLDQNIHTAEEFMKSCNSAESVMNLLKSSLFFEDVFLKRAQVTTYLISKTLDSETGRGFFDLSLLTAMPDYRLPQLLYNTNIVNIPESLKQKLLRKEIIQKDSIEELALRSSVILVCQKIAEQVGEMESDVDSLMWSLSQEYKDQNKLIIPAMLVETDCY